MLTQRCGHELAALLLPVLLLSVLLGCEGRRTAEDAPAASLEPVSAASPSSGRLFAVLINGGGRRQINYHSHLEHLSRLIDLLKVEGVADAEIATFSSDGQNPGADLAIREGDLHPDFWLLPSRLARRIGSPVVYVDSQIDGVTLKPATRGALRDWFELEGSQLAAGDTLLFYVTDHGKKNAEDLTNNSIALWGEMLSVTDLREMFGLIDPGVRVVMLMSQCYSGAFANAIFSETAELPEGNVCGYFSATADREASGCYPEVSGKEAVGYSHRMITALESQQRLTFAQHEVLITDRTPDVPHTSSSFFLEERLNLAAERGGHEPSTFIDDLLREAFQEPQLWEPEIQLLDRVGQAFGFGSPRSLAELESQADDLADQSRRLQTYARQWERALNDLRVANLNDFRVAHPEWGDQLDPRTRIPGALDAEQRRIKTHQLLDALAPFTAEAPRLETRLQELRRRHEEAADAKYRVDVRLGVVLRIRALLTETAGRLFMARYASEDERGALARLDTCEDLIMGEGPGRANAREFEAGEPYPTLAEERRIVEASMPAWLGIRYDRPGRALRERYSLSTGAVVVKAVLPGSPAAEAGLQVTDILLGPPGELFLERHAVREWTMQGEPGRRVYLDLLRDGEPLEIALALGRFPASP